MPDPAGGSQAAAADPLAQDMAPRPGRPGDGVDATEDAEADDDDPDDGPEERAEDRGPKWRLPLRIVGIVAMLVVIAFALQGKLPKPSEVWDALLTANWLWVLVGAVAMFVSIFAFAEQQRQLLAAFDTRISRKRITIITYGGTALTNSLPAGAAVSAGYSFTQYRASGANRSTAATVMVLSGLLSIGSLAVMYFLVIGAATGTAFLTLLRNNPDRVRPGRAGRARSVRRASEAADQGSTRPTSWTARRPGWTATSAATPSSPRWPGTDSKPFGRPGRSG